MKFPTREALSVVKMSSGVHLGKGSPKPVLPDDGVLRLYSMRFCPYAHRVHLVLDAKKIPYHSIFINLAEKPEWLTELSPLGKVPALQLVKDVGNPSLIESLIISEYLDEKYPEVPLYPKDPLRKAADKILIDRFTDVTRAFFKMATFGVESAPGAFPDMLLALDIYEKELQARGTPYFSGDKPGMVDYMIWPWVERTTSFKYVFDDTYELNQQRYGNLLKWCDLMNTDHAVKCFYLPGDIHAKFIRSRKEGKPDYNIRVNDITGTSSIQAKSKL